MSHVLGFSVSASLRPPDSLLCRWEVACLLGRAGGLQLTTSKMRNTPSKIRNRKATTSSGLSPPRPFCFGTSKKRRCGELRIPGTTLLSWDAEQASSPASHPRNDFASLGCGADEFVCPMLPTRRFAAEGRGGSEPKGMAVTRMDVAWRGTRRGRACASSALNQRERDPPP